MKNRMHHLASRALRYKSNAACVNGAVLDAYMCLSDREALSPLSCELVALLALLPGSDVTAVACGRTLVGNMCPLCRDTEDEEMNTDRRPCRPAPFIDPSQLNRDTERV